MSDEPTEERIREGFTSDRAWRQETLPMNLYTVQLRVTVEAEVQTSSPRGQGVTLLFTSEPRGPRDARRGEAGGCGGACRVGGIACSWGEEPRSRQQVQSKHCRRLQEAHSACPDTPQRSLTSFAGADMKSRIAPMPPGVRGRQVQDDACRGGEPCLQNNKTPYPAGGSGRS